MDISSSPVVGMNVNLDAAKKKLDDAISEIEERCKAATAEAIKGIEVDIYDNPVVNANKVRQLQAENSPGAFEGYNYLLMQRRMFNGEEVEICCPDTGFHVWARTQEEAVALWERVVAQLGTLEDCCHDKANHKTVYTGGGFPLVRCTECGRRHVPMP